MGKLFSWEDLEVESMCLKSCLVKNCEGKTKHVVIAVVEKN